MRELDPLAVPLAARTLIEASAGTGKTYSIVALYLRAVVGHGIARPLGVGEVAVVTFTNAASQELVSRIRDGLVAAEVAFATGAARDPWLARLVASTPDRDGARKRLVLARQRLDEAAVDTIHGFCLRALRDLAFDSGAAFTQRYVLNDDEYRRAGVTDAWRRLVYGADAARSELVCTWFPTPAHLWRVLQPQIRRPDLAADLPGGDFDAASGRLRDLLAQVHARGRRDDVVARVRQAGYKKDRNGRGPGDPDRIAALAAWLGADAPAMSDAAGRTFVDVLQPYASASMLDPGLVKKRGGALPDCAAFAKAVDWVLDAAAKCRGVLLAQSREEANALAAIAKATERVISPDDVLETMRGALRGEGGARFAARLAQRFPLAMIDEFQDTDPVQWEVFSRIYAHGRGGRQACGLVLIGDPKQAIFGFRGADVFAYVQARREQVAAAAAAGAATAHADMAASGEAPASGGMLSLSVCRRSSPPLITALNRLFAGPDGRGTGFLLDGVDYVPVAPPAAGARAPLRAGGREVPALTLCVLEADGKPVGVTRMREVMAADAAARVRALIDDASIDVDGERLRPGQVAILVRDRSDAQQMLVALRRWGVESAYLNRDSVLSSAAARALRDVLAAVASPGDEGLLRNVLLGPLVGLGFDALRARVADEVAWQQDVERFRRYGDAWRRQGVLVMLRNFMADYDVARVVLARSGGARLLTDVRHVGELLHAQSAARPGSEALLRWLDRHDERLAEDEAQQMRLESDENLVKVVTIHGAKGLEWDVVLVPFATPGRSDTPGVWHRAEGAGYRAVWDVLETRTDDVDRERLAEDLRLLYVAVTRARRALFLSVCHCDRRGGRESNVPFARSALAHVLFGAAASSAAVADLRPRLQALRDGCDAIAIVDVDGDADTAAATSGAAAAQDATAVPPAEAGMPVPAARRFGGSIDRSYRVTSYTSLVAADADAAGAAAAAMADAEPGAADEGADIDDGGGRADDAIEARFPRGAAAGVALHALLEEMAREGTAIDAAAVEGTLRAHGLHQVARDAAAVLAWLTRVRGTRLAPLDLALDGCRRAVAEMEFTLPLAPLDTRALWSLLRAHGYRGDPLPSRRLAGLLRGYIDLVVAHDGGYCIVDYKSNALGATPAAYGDAAMQRAMREHRYDLQMLLYTLALRRHLRAHRREARIDVFYLFLRGVDGSGNGIWHHAPDAAVLDALDALFDGSGAPVR